MKSPEEIVGLMMHKDAFSQWVGMETLSIGLGKCSLQCKVNPEMLNGFQIAHGGITYSLADSTLAFASNSRGVQCVSTETSISHIYKVKDGDVLTSVSKEISRGRTIGIYDVEIFNQDKKLVAHFKGTVLVTGTEW